MEDINNALKAYCDIFNKDPEDILRNLMLDINILGGQETLEEIRNNLILQVEYWEEETTDTSSELSEVSSDDETIIEDWEGYATD